MCCAGSELLYNTYVLLFFTVISKMKLCDFLLESAERQGELMLYQKE